MAVLGSAGEREWGKNGKASQRCVRWAGVSFEREAVLKCVFPGVFLYAVELIQCKE